MSISSHSPTAENDHAHIITVIMSDPAQIKRDLSGGTRGRLSKAPSPFGYEADPYSLKGSLLILSSGYL